MRLLFRSRLFHLMCCGLASLMLLAAGPVSAAGPKGLPSCETAAAGQQCDPNAAGPVPDPVPNWVLSKVRYQRWANVFSFSGIPEISEVSEKMSGLVGGEALADTAGLAALRGGEVTYCMDRDAAALCKMDGCTVKVLSRSGLTSVTRADCPDFQGTVKFVWAPDGLSWKMDHKFEPSPDMPSGVGMLVRSRYLGPCTEAEALRDR
jgi:hypothetical protein